MKISASILSSKKIDVAVKELSLTDVDYIHVDFIDDTFINGKKIPFRKLKKISKYSPKRLDIHLMTSNIKKYIKKFASLNAEYITFHIEATDKVEELIELIHNYGIHAGLAINPETDIEKVKSYLNDIDLVLIMSVNPGYGGQSFIPETVEKVKTLREYLNKEKLKVLINVDGGINNETSNEVKKYVDIMVSGSYITNSDNFQEKISSLR